MVIGIKGILPEGISSFDFLSNPPRRMRYIGKILDSSEHGRVSMFKSDMTSTPACYEHNLFKKMFKKFGICLSTSKASMASLNWAVKCPIKKDRFRRRRSSSKIVRSDCSFSVAKRNVIMMDYFFLTKQNFFLLFSQYFQSGVTC